MQIRPRYQHMLLPPESKLVLTPSTKEDNVKLFMQLNSALWGQVNRPVSCDQ